MVTKKIKKSESTLAGLTFSILIAIVLFTGFFYWISANAVESGREVDEMYNTSFTGLQTELTNLSTTINQIRDAASDITEPKEGFLTAWNGLKGLLNIFRIPLNLIDIAWQSYQLMVTPLAGIIPRWLIDIVAIGLVAFIIYIIVSIFKGDNNVIR
jgi:hypothetical protein